MSATLYIVTQIGWEYNDEYYYKTSGGSPCEAYTSYELAEISAIEKTTASVKKSLETDSEGFVLNFMSHGGNSKLELRPEWIEKCKTDSNIIFKDSSYGTIYPVTINNKNVVNAPDSFYKEFVYEAEFSFYEITEIDWIA